MLLVTEPQAADVPFSTDYHDVIDPGSYASANTVFDRWWSKLDAQSVVDFGCGSGAWLRSAKEHGASDVLGIDGSWANPPTGVDYRAADLTKPVTLDRTFDLAICVEVAEHLPEEAADTLVQTIVGFAEMVLWSAAIPGQGGHNHINEQPPEYWAAKFAEHGWEGTTAVRAGLDGPIEWWYAQNLMIYAPKGHLPTMAARIAVYAPAKNEGHNVKAWAKSAKDADEIVLVDTGSTDDTLRIARAVERKKGAKKFRVETADVSPWRFDDGFNAALSQVSADIDIAVPLHLDERLQSGWREELEVAWRAGGRQFTFVYDWGQGLTYRHDRIHARSGYRWVGAAHEYPSGPGPRIDTNVRIVQERDASKDRSQDDALIELAWRENPTCAHDLLLGASALLPQPLGRRAHAAPAIPRDA